MIKSDHNKKYRDFLVEQIKSAGYQLIDRAEEMISENISYITNFNINIDIPLPYEGHTTISWTTETFDTRIVEGFDGSEKSETKDK